MPRGALLAACVALTLGFSLAVVPQSFYGPWTGKPTFSPLGPLNEALTYTFSEVGLACVPSQPPSLAREFNIQRGPCPGLPL